mmetsp:Transcript_64674/g.75896  ORF Transcript_64674/g.75896 Transcript_64674/m.75896 type:complete len:109 (+) Transcript_64674:662-988(+)|eukprot:CAMPEP_0194387276 /NCGR_PEP_ID=MMETSP0174-20130528/91355_1 /TAXON_ID=216777 /ORGANISM="Proboscia alata, Strain PI-D3" /LENGTH=108 /DNA_ID=CAMNT_0039177271 /DNA_START=631 /DNA_END=957 /DNA_ORIENTATION=-
MLAKKDELKQRLKKALDNEVLVEKKKESVRNKKDNTKTPSKMGAFAPGVYWKPFSLDEEPAKDPENSAFNPRAPTIVERDATFVLVKYSFSQYKFEIMTFNGATKKLV